jgi:hypothetical protein
MKDPSFIHRFALSSGSVKFPVTISADAPLTELLKVVEEVTGVPTSGQKLVLGGRALTSLDHNRSLRDVGVVQFAKVMVLGKRYDPEADDQYRQIQEVERKTMEIDARLAEVSKECADIEAGYLAKEHHEKALKGLVKRCRTGTEEFMRLLERLDAMQFEERQTEARHRRKLVADRLNGWLDSTDEMQNKIEQMLDMATGKS